MTRSFRAIVVFGALLLSAWPAAADEERAGVDLAARDAIAQAWNGRPVPADAWGRVEERLRNMRRVRCLELAGIHLTSTQRSGDTATVEADVASWKGDALHVMPLRLRMQHRDGTWRVSAVELPEEELADRLLAAAPDEAAHLLVENEARLTADFMRVLDTRVRKLVPSGDERAFAAAARQRELALLTGDRVAEALNLTTRANLSLGTDIEAAEALSREAIAIAGSTGDADASAWAWYVFAGVMLRRDLHASTNEDSYRTALDFAERAEDPTPMISTLLVLATLASIKADLVTARRLLVQSTPLVAGTADLEDDLQLELALALVYQQQDDRELALHHLQRCLQLAGDSKRLRAQVLLRLADILTADDRLDEAERALAEARDLAPPRSLVHPFLMERRGILEMRKGNLDKAECMLREAAAQYATAGFKYGPALDQLTPSLMKAKNYTAALRLSLEQIPYVEERTPIDAAKALTMAAQAYAALGDGDRAAAVLDEAIALHETLSERIAGGEEQKIHTSEATAASYELRAELALQAGDVGAALAFVERGRGRVLYDVISGGRATPEGGQPQEVARAEEQLSLLAVQLARAEAAHAPAAAALRARLEEARRDHRSLLDGLRERAERRVAATRPLDAASLDDVLASLPPAMAAVEYVVRDEQVDAFVVRREDGRPVIRHYAIPIRRQALEQRVSAFVRMVSAGDLRYRAAARGLHRLLVAPFERDLAAAEAICLVPDEVLWRLPFAALVDARNRFLVERWALVHAPSITVYAAIVRRPRGATRRGPDVLMVANPTLADELRENLTSVYRGMVMGALPDAEREVETVSALYPPRQCLVLARDRGTESRVKSAISGMRMVHFATHGILDDLHPMYSRLVLARGDAGDDGSLEAWEVARLDVPADLVVLSACDTARGTIATGEGVVGMAWSFFVAGARSTVATQWRVDSRSAAALMIAFHESLRGREGDRSLRKARSLRDSQLRLIGDPRTRHPFHWAAFVLLGDAS